jgi:acetoin utilization deacetylase AcuC-like enzyme
MVMVFYDVRMSIESGSYSPSGSKPEMVLDNWSDISGLQCSSFDPISRDDLLLVHHKDFVDGIFDGTIQNGHGNFSRGIANSCLWTCGSMLAAANWAVDNRVACSPSSGFHHAGYDFAGGFCTFNGLMVTAVKVSRARGIKIGILDLDYHYGNGTDSILGSVDGLRKSIFHWTFGRNSEFVKPTWFLDNLPVVIKTFKDVGVSLILYQAGADMHIKDPLGGLLTSPQMKLRDEIVFRECREAGISVAWNLAGGYRRSSRGGIGPVLKTHRNTMEACIETFKVEV